MAKARLAIVSFALCSIAANGADRNASTRSHDPGVRSGQADAGAMLPNLSGPERQLFAKGREVFERINSVQGDAVVAGTEAGLGPLFNLDRCAGCHGYPATGGSSPPENPQISVAHREGAGNRIPSFVKPDGPAYQVRVRWPHQSAPDGLILPLFTITGRRDAGNCELSQLDFQNAFAQGVLRFRVPPPLFGDGLIEAIPDAEILANRDAYREEKRRSGIQGHPNDGGSGIGRFGWKGGIRSLDLFVAEAYWIEQGVTSEIFPEERGTPPANCLLNATPEDRKNTATRTALDTFTNVSLLAHYVRFLAAPLADGPTGVGDSQGKRLFEKVGCSLCHTPELNTGRSSWPSLAGQTIHLYSDLLVHHMGAGLADGLVDGSAGPDEFRTAPLWGLGQRLFLLHDGRTRDLVQAVLAHSDRVNAHPKGARRYPKSEADQVIENYLRLDPAEQQSLLRFLRYL